jgi:cytochrome d ubiquinol oxidase subunit II
LIPFWFIVITVLWLGFFVLEGFDFGVGILHGPAGGGEAGRRTAINAIGPLWDGNEVWLIVAIAAMFAAFPAWYATMLSGFYLVVVLLLAALIVRGVAFEYRGKRDSARWRRTWDVLMTAGSLIAPFLIGLSLADLIHGVPIGPGQRFTGGLGSLFTGYAVFTGLTVTAVCVLHGATFLALKTAGEVRERAGRIARRAGWPVALAVVAFAAWTHAASGQGVLLNPVELLAVLAALAAAWLAAGRREGWAFAATTVTMGAIVLTVFVDLYPRVMVSSTSPALSLTAPGTASGHYSLTVMTVVAVILLPFVLAYQSWSYYVFRRRLRPETFAAGSRRAGGRAAGGGAFAATASAGASSAADQEPGTGAPAAGSPATDSAGPRAPSARRLDRARRGRRRGSGD